MISLSSKEGLWEGVRFPMTKRVRIFSLGGNEVSPVDIKDPKTGKSVIPDIPMQWQRTADTCKVIADVIEKNPDDYYILTHGNGPQVGNILLRAEYSRPILFPLPLDICVADTQSAMGYMLAQLQGELDLRGIHKTVSAVATRVVVNGNDPDFKNPSKYIGPQYTREEAEERRRVNGWNVKMYGKDKEGNEIWRRVVPSPVPTDVVEVDVVEGLMKAGAIPISVGGGGIPVIESEPQIEGEKEVYRGSYGIKFERVRKPGQKKARVFSGVEAVVDKDLASALLGKLIMERAKARGEDLEVSLTIFTAEDGAKLNYKKPDQKDLRKLTVREAQEVLEKYPDQFPAGSMGPKLRAVMQFVESGGKVAYITKTPLLEKTLAGEAGTTIVP